MNTCKYVIFKKAGWYYVELQASNGTVMFTSHGYAKRSTAQDGITVLVQLILSKPMITFGQDRTDQGE